jgi:hypothetical protein
MVAITILVIAMSVPIAAPGIVATDYQPYRGSGGICAAAVRHAASVSATVKIASAPLTR